MQVLELEQGFPFNIQRIFTISQVPQNETRGEHAHYKCEQFLWLVEGSIDIAVTNKDGLSAHKLDSSNRILHLPPMHWCDMSNFSIKSCLIVLASEKYDPADYISNRDEFLRLVKTL